MNWALLLRAAGSTLATSDSAGLSGRSRDRFGPLGAFGAGERYGDVAVVRSEAQSELRRHALHLCPVADR
jgi:hypothetical protein